MEHPQERSVEEIVSKCLYDWKFESGKEMAIRESAFQLLVSALAHERQLREEAEKQKVSEFIEWLEANKPLKELETRLSRALEVIKVKDKQLDRAWNFLQSTQCTGSMLDDIAEARELRVE